jgi:hypothetical protein
MVDNCEAANNAKKKVLTFDLQNGLIVIEGIDGFSVDTGSPTVSLSNLYKAVFKDLEKGEQIEVTCTSKLKNASQSFSIYESIKRIIDGTMTSLASDGS